MAIDDNTSYELTGAQVKDLAARIKAGGGGGMTVYVDASFATPSSITGVFSDSALTTPADPDAMAGIISAGSTVIVVYDGGQSEEVIELSSVNSNSRFPEVGQAFTSVISTNAIFSAPTMVTCGQTEKVILYSITKKHKEPYLILRITSETTQTGAP